MSKPYLIFIFLTLAFTANSVNTKRAFHCKTYVALTVVSDKLYIRDDPFKIGIQPYEITCSNESDAAYKCIASTGICTVSVNVTCKVFFDESYNLFYVLTSDVTTYDVGKYFNDDE
jgi:hypothetical protein